MSTRAIPKRSPCTSCGAKGGKKHKDTCLRPQGRKVTDAVASNLVATPRRGRLRNRTAFVIDSSSSMARFQRDVPRIVREQVNIIKNTASNLQQETSINYYTFNGLVNRIAQNLDVENVDRETFGRYSPVGNTALLDAVGVAITDLRNTPNAEDPDTSFLLIIVTDGEENSSRNFTKRSLQTLMNDVERTDRWSLVFSVPRGLASNITDLGVPSGNIQEWDQTQQGFETMSHNINQGIQSYMTLRSAGGTKTANFFAPDLRQVSRTAIQNLDDLSQSFQTWNVPSTNNLPIREFVESMLAQQPALARKVGSTYKSGNAYYQLTKTERVQASKDIVLLDKATNALYGGVQARGLIGCPTNVLFTLKPGEHDQYEIFVKSTSVNRKLVPGTKVLYFVG